MNLTFTDIQKRGGNWLFLWEPTDARFYRIVLFGTELATLPAGTGSFLYTLGVPSYPNHPPPIELVEEGDLALSEIFPPFITLQWYNDSTNEQIVDHYQLQQQVGASWKDGPSIKEDGTWVHSIDTPVLSDGKTYTFRIIAVGPNQESSCARVYQVRMVCCPVLVENSLSIKYDNASQDVVITGV